MQENTLDYETVRRESASPCPFCRSKSVVNGKLTSADGSSTGCFFPGEIKPFVWTFTPPYIEVDRPAFICLECGAVWSQVDAAAFGERYARWSKGGVT